MNFVSPRKAPEFVPLTEHAIRQLIANGKCPGFYVGSHFKVDVDRLLERLNAASEKNGNAEELEGGAHYVKADALS